MKYIIRNLRENLGLKGLIGVNMGRERSRSVESKPNVSKVGNVGSGGSRRVWSFLRERERRQMRC